MPIRTIMVGCGQIARQTHIPNILTSEKFELVGIVEPNKKVAELALSLFGLEVPVYSAVTEIEQCEAAVVAVPPHLHAETCVQLIEKKIHVLCEKPMATKYCDCVEMINAARKNNRVLLIGMTKHYCPNTQLMADIIKEGYLGSILSYELASGTRSQWDAANPKRYDPEYVPGGVTFENGVHWIYRLLLWFGKAQVTEYKDDRIDGVEANAIIRCSHDWMTSPVEGKMIFSADHVLGNRLIVKGMDRSAVVLEKDETALYISEKINGTDVWLKVQRDMAENTTDLFKAQMDHFYRCIREGSDPEVTPDLSAMTIAFLENAYKIREELEQPWASFRTHRGTSYAD